MTTLNLGIYFYSVADAIDWFPIKTYPKEYDCTIRQRIGMLMPDYCDKWWNVTLKMNIEKIQAELITAWTDYGEPWLAEVSTLKGAKEALIKAKGYFQAAGIALLQEKRDEARELLLLEIKDKPLAKAKLNSWGRKNKLIK